MAGENDIFSVLGRVEVDLATLRASLGAAEKEVAASASRQQKTWTEFANSVVDQQRKIAEAQKGAKAGEASGLYKMMYGGGESAKGVTQTADAFKKLHEATGHSIGSMRGFARAIDVVAPGLGYTSEGLLHVIHAFGPLAAGFAAAAGSVALFVTASNKATTSVLEFNRATYIGAIDELSAKYQKLADEAKNAEVGIGGLLHRLTGQPSQAKIAAVIAAEQLREAFFSAEQEELRGIEIHKVENQTLQKSNEYSLENAEGIRDVEKARRGLNATNLRAIQLAEDQERLTFKASAEFKKNEETEGTRAVNVEKLAQIQKKYAAQRTDLLEQQSRDTDADNRKEAAQVAARIDSEVKRIDLEKAAVAARQQTNTIRLESDRALEVAEAEFRSREIQGTDAYLKEKEKSLNEGINLEKIAAEESFKLRRENLTGLIAAGGPGATIRGYRRQLDELAKEEESSYAQLAEKKKQIDIQSNQKRIEEERKAAQQRQQVAEQALQHSAAMGRVTVQETVNFWNSVSGDMTLSIEKRREAERNAMSDAIKGAQSFFALRQAQGFSTFTQEIAWQTEQNKLYKVGSDEWLKGLTAVANKQKEMRDVAASAVGGVQSLAVESLKKKGRKTVTKGDIEGEIYDLSIRSQQQISAFTSGGRVKIDEVGQLIPQARAFEAFQREGGSYGELFGRAITPLVQSTTTFASGANTFSKAVDTFAASVGASIPAVPGTTGAASKEAPGEYSEYFRARRESALTASWLSDPYLHKVSETVGRNSQLEGRRGPVPVQNAQ